MRCSIFVSGTSIVASSFCSSAWKNSLGMIVNLVSLSFMNLISADTGITFASSKGAGFSTGGSGYFEAAAKDLKVGTVSILLIGAC